MCNNEYYIHETAIYFRKILSEDVTFIPANKDLIMGVPWGISSIFSFYEGCILGQQILLAYTEDCNSVSPGRMKKLLAIVSKYVKRVVVLITPNISSYNKIRLVAQRVNFVIPNKQMFLPSLLLEIKQEHNKNTDLKEIIPPFAQCLLLYHLQIESVVGVNSYALSDKFAVSYATVNKSLRWLLSKELINLVGAKTKTVQINLNNRELWNKALPLLVSPIEHICYVDDSLEGQMMSGVNALSSYTMINGIYTQSYAMSKKVFKTLSIETDKQFGQNEIQIWRYDPRILSSTGVVDRLSLYLSLMNNDDERIQIELERLIKDMPW